ncbi:MAG: glycosyltransferase family 39 protein [Clostridium sp.]|nr:glycosyltransferase family 39 protein [Clostridium sp.]MCM1547824.1 glycosyltransferase family 39 protein [Ruminococcus sp.]
MEKICKTVWGIFAVIFGMTIISVMARGYVKFSNVKITAVIIFGVIFTASVIYLYSRLRHKALFMTHSQANKIFFCISAAVLVLQLISAFALKFEPINDLKHINNAAKDFCLMWDKTALYDHLPEYHNGYFARYTNNQAILIVLSLVYSLCEKIFSCTPLIVPILLNTLGLHISFVLIYFTAGKIFRDNFTPLFCSVIAAGFTVFYTYTPFFYTDSMSMPFAIGSIYLFLCAAEGKMSVKKAVQMTASALLLVIGFKIKGNVIILLPAYILYFIATCSKLNKKAYIKAMCVFLSGLTVCFIGVGAFVKSFDIANESELNERQFPLEHWVMMGLHDRGGYYKNDFLFTENSGDFNQKKSADIEMIKDRISEYGIVGMTKHLAKKVSYTWGDGTYFIGYYIKSAKNPNLFKKFVTDSTLFKFYCSVYQCMLLLMILYSFITGAVSGGKSKDVLLKIIICGVFFFFVIWETRSRYLVNFTPIFIITSVHSIKLIASVMERRFLRAGIIKQRRTQNALTKNAG